MSEEHFDPEALLLQLPQRRLDLLPAGQLVPKMPSVGSLSDYNGFTGKARLRTFEIAKWLIKLGAYDAPRTCSLCSKPANKLHAENYYEDRPLPWLPLVAPAPALHNA